MAEFIPFDPPHVLVKFRLIEGNPATLAPTFPARCLGHDGYQSYWVGLGSRRVRFRRDGREAVGPKSKAMWELCPEYLAQLPPIPARAGATGG